MPTRFMDKTARILLEARIVELTARRKQANGYVLNNAMQIEADF